MARSLKIGAVFICMLLLSCHTYRNFRAYYNTYYNAKKSFRAGVEQVTDQPKQIVPSSFITIYPIYPVVGRSYFEEAIKNAAQVLRRFSQTKWTDNALLLIGRSYFYLHNYYQALEKFDALLQLSQKNEQYRSAVIWKLRSLTATHTYQTGMIFARSILEENTHRWTDQQKALVNVFLSQFLAKAGNLQSASDTLLSYIPLLEKNKTIGRSYFLLGQLYLQQQKYDQSFRAFGNAAQYQLGYEINYYARLKRGDAAVLSNRIPVAISIYKQLLSDDKNQTRHAQIMYRWGLALEQAGKYEQAKLLYRRALGKTNKSDLSFKLYSQMARLVSTHFKEYETAAAYLDSSKVVGGGLERQPGDSTRAYRRYIALKAEISEAKRMLRLSNLPPERLKAIIRDRRERRKEKLTAENRGTRLDSSFEDSSKTNKKSYDTSFGFLNYKNEALVAQGIEQFEDRWGNRPLVDNWRVVEAAEGAEPGNRIVSTEQNGAETEAEARENEEKSLLEKIPFTKEQKQLKQEQIHSLQYQLANLFFLTLNKPDSAAVYYKKVVGDSNKQELVVKALYSLYQLNRSAQQSGKMKHYRRHILSRYPNSIYADRLTNETYNGDFDENVRHEVNTIMADSSITMEQKAHQLEQLAVKNKRRGWASAVYYRSIKVYIKAAKAKQKKVHGRSESIQNGKVEYSGPHWDVVRQKLDVFQNLFPHAPQSKQIKILQDTLDGNG